MIAGSALGFPERRQAIRFPLALPVELERGRGITRDVSVSGVYFETDQSFSLGESIRLTLVLERVYPGRPVHLQCQGQIVRVERREGKVGVAVAITSYLRLETPGQSGPVG